MASSHRYCHPKPTKKEECESMKNPNPNPISHMEYRNPNFIPKPFLLDGSEEGKILSGSNVLTREEVLRRRSLRAKQLIKYYGTQYWAIMEEIRVKYRDYYWRYGKSPFKEVVEEEKSGNGIEGTGENNGLGLGFDNETDTKNDGSLFTRCAFPTCKSKAMALTRYCHSHILSDTKQKLYKACTYVIRSSPSGPVTCGKPVLRAAIPSLCTVHFQRAQKQISQALKKAGFNNISSNKPAPKFHVIISEYVRQIQAKRREVLKKFTNNGNGVSNNVKLKEENV